MNQVKDYYQDESLHLANAFRWQNKILTTRYKRNGIGYYLALQVSLLSGISLVTAFGEFLSSVRSINLILMLGFGIIVVSIVVFISPFKRNLEKK
jgi:hypothetical protein